MLEIKDLHASVNGKEILKGINLSIKKGEVHAIMGSSPLGVDDFVKKSSFLYYTREALGEVAPRIADFAEREGLHAHAKSVTIRYEED